MKKQLIFIAAALLALASCKEQIPAGLVLQSLLSKDTTYVTATIETAQNKRILIEELTGASCTNCPAGTQLIKNFHDQNPDRVISIAIHSGFLTEPPAGAVYDFRNADADALKLFFNEGDPGKPSASFDRVPALSGNSVGKYFILKGQTGADWITALNLSLAKITPVNIHLTSSYSAVDNKVIVTVKLHFTENITADLGLTLFVLENGRKDIQEDKDVGEIHDYVFNHVLRKVITPIAGEPILDSLATKVKGRVLEKSLQFEPSTSGVNGWNLDSCVIVAVVHKTGSVKEVLHAEEVHMK